MLAQVLQGDGAVDPQPGLSGQVDGVIEVIDGGGGPAQRVRQDGPVGPGGGQARVCAQRRRVAGPGARGVPGLGLQRAPRGEQVRVVRVHGQATPDVLAGPLRLAQRHQDVGPVDERVHLVGLQLQHVVQVSQRRAVVAQFPQQVGPVDVHLKERRAQLDGPGVVVQGARCRPGRAAQPGALEVVVGVLGVRGDDVIERGQRLVVLAEGGQHEAPVVHQHRAVQLVLGRSVGSVHPAGRLLDQGQRASAVAAVQFDQGAGVAHEGAAEGALAGVRVMVGDRDRGVGPLQGRVVVAAGLGQVSGVEHGQHVRGTHVDLSVHVDPAQLPEALQGLRPGPGRPGRPRSCA